MGDLSIKVTIAGRVYPLSVQDHEEEKIRQAAKVIDELVKKFETKYAVKDKQDLLAMCALEFATQKLNYDKVDTSSAKEKGGNELKDLDDYISGYLSQH